MMHVCACDLHETRMCLCWVGINMLTGKFIPSTAFSYWLNDLYSLFAFVQAAAVVIKCHDLQDTVIEFADITWAKMSQWYNLIRNVFSAQTY